MLRRVALYGFSNFAFFLAEVARRAPDIEWSAIIPRAPQRGAFSRIVPPERTLYLFDRLPQAFAADPPMPSLAGAEDNLPRLLAVDKDGWRHEEACFQHRLAAAHATVFGDFLDRVRPDCVVFPPLETVDGAILLALCQTRGILPAHAVHMRNLGKSFFSHSMYDARPPYFGSCDDGHRAEARAFITEFLAGRRGAAEQADPGEEHTRIPLRVPPLPVRVARSLAASLGPERLYRGEDGPAMAVKRNLIRPLTAFRRKRHEWLRDRVFDLGPGRGTLPERFVLYAAQVTPESSINTLAQYFVDQERAIDALRLALPDGHALVVKEHPAIAGSRPMGFYRRLRRMPGVVLAAPELPMRELVAKAALVTAVTGTVGLEAWLMGKPTLLFGRCFFDHLCARAEGFDLRAQLDSLIHRYRVPTEAERVEEIAKLMAIGHRFAPFEPLFRPDAMAEGNVLRFLGALRDHAARIKARIPA